MTPHQTAFLIVLLAIPVACVAYHQIKLELEQEQEELKEAEEREQTYPVWIKYEKP